jgi:hypothetical protein
MPLRYVDPRRKRGRIYRVSENFGRSGAGQWFARHISTRLDPVLYRATGGRFTTSMGVVVNAPLVTIGVASRGTCQSLTPADPHATESC